MPVKMSWLLNHIKGAADPGNDTAIVENVISILSVLGFLDVSKIDMDIDLQEALREQRRELNHG